MFGRFGIFFEKRSMGDVPNIHAADSYKYILSNLKSTRVFRASFKKMYAK